MKYRKIFIPRPMEPSKPGREFPVYEAEGIGKIALMICADAHVPEVSHNLALNGAELVLKPGITFTLDRQRTQFGAGGADPCHREPLLRIVKLDRTLSPWATPASVTRRADRGGTGDRRLCRPS